MASKCPARAELRSLAGRGLAHIQLWLQLPQRGKSSLLALDGQWSQHHGKGQALVGSVAAPKTFWGALGGGLEGGEEGLFSDASVVC